jgi:hypothetical protein
MVVQLDNPGLNPGGCRVRVKYASRDWNKPHARRKELLLASDTRGLKFAKDPRVIGARVHRAFEVLP